MLLSTLQESLTNLCSIVIPLMQPIICNVTDYMTLCTLVSVILVYPLVLNFVLSTSQMLISVCHGVTSAVHTADLGIDLLFVASTYLCF